MNLIERFKRKVFIDTLCVSGKPELGPCWLWTPSVNEHGYGRLLVDGVWIKAHRLSYELFKGLLPDDLEVDHLCRIRKCVNPDHLELVTHEVNQSRAIMFNGLKTHCVNGHEFTTFNTYIRRNGGRQCKTCTLIS